MATERQRLVREVCDDPAVAVDDKNASAGSGRPDRQRLLECVGAAGDMRTPVARRMVDLGAKMIGERRDCLRRVEHDLAAVLEYLDRLFHYCVASDWGRKPVAVA